MAITASGAVTQRL